MKKNILISVAIGGLTGLLWFVAWLLLGVIFNQNGFLSPIFEMFSRSIVDKVTECLVKSKLVNMHDAITPLMIVCFISVIIGSVIGLSLFCGNYVFNKIIVGRVGDKPDTVANKNRDGHEKSE
jgi:hypothetical protein